MTKEQIDYLITGMFMQACDVRAANLAKGSWGVRRLAYQFKTLPEWAVHTARSVALMHQQRLESTLDLTSWTYTLEGLARQDAEKRFMQLTNAVLNRGTS